MVRGIYQDLSSDAPKKHFTIGIHDDVTHTSLPYDPHFSVESSDVVLACFMDWVPMEP